uniref:RRM domain-containing protein n=1 Tax=Strongyloides stercoralis TaxID=6248 RepID=A0A0K0DU08_STRER
MRKKRMTRKYKGSTKRGSSIRSVKISIRHLPPELTEEELTTYFKGFLNPGTYQFYPSADFKLSTDAFSFCTVSFKNNEMAMEFAKKFDGKVIKSGNGTATNISIEIATNEKNAFKKMVPTKDTSSITSKLKESKVFKDYFNEEDKRVFVPDFSKMLEEIEEQETRRIFGDLRETPLTKEVGVIYLTKEERGGIRFPKDKKEREKRFRERKEKKQAKKSLKIVKREKLKSSDLEESPMIIVNSQYKSGNTSSSQYSPSIKIESKSGNKLPGIILAKRNTDSIENILSKSSETRNKKGNEKSKEFLEKKDKNIKNKKDKPIDKKKKVKDGSREEEVESPNITFTLKKKENDSQERQKSDTPKVDTDNDSGKQKRRGYVPGMVAKKIFENTSTS